MEKAIFEAINNLAGRYVWWDWPALFFADYAGYLLAAILLAIFIFKKNAYSRWTVIMALVAAVVSRGIIVSVIKFLYYRPRPFEVLQIVQLIPENNSSFPSGHAALYFALSTVIFFYNRKLGAIFLAVSALMGVARIYVGVHWPLDILGGAVIGVLTGWVANLLFQKYYLKTKTLA